MEIELKNVQSRLSEMMGFVDMKGRFSIRIRLGFATIFMIVLGAFLFPVRDVRANVVAPQVLLVQNSGWMEPFYTDPTSRFRELLVRFADAAAQNSDGLVVASFNQEGQLSGRANPHVIGKVISGQAHQAIAKLDLPRRVNGQYADSDFLGTLKATIVNVLSGKPGVVWIVTNNKNSPGNDQNVAGNTSRFYEVLRSSDGIKRVVAYLLPMNVKGRNYGASGLIVYGIGYGTEGGEALSAITEGEEMRRILTDPPVLLKPIEQAPISFLPRKVSGTEGVTVSSRGTFLFFEGLNAEVESIIQLDGELASNFYPYTIRRAQVSAKFVPIKGKEYLLGRARISVEPNSISNVDPMTTVPNVTLRIRIPEIPRPDGFAGIVAEDNLVAGAIRLQLTDLDLAFSAPFERKLAAVALGEVLPDLFFDFKSVTSASRTIPIAARVSFSRTPLVLAIGGGIVALLLGAGLLWGARSVPVTVDVGGRRLSPRLRPFGSTVLQDEMTGQHYKVRRGFLASATATPVDSQGLGIS